MPDSPLSARGSRAAHPRPASRPAARSPPRRENHLGPRRVDISPWPGRDLSENALFRQGQVGRGSVWSQGGRDRTRGAAPRSSREDSGEDGQAGSQAAGRVGRSEWEEPAYRRDLGRRGLEVTPSGATIRPGAPARVRPRLQGRPARCSRRGRSGRGRSGSRDASRRPWSPCSGRIRPPSCPA